VCGASTNRGNDSLSVLLVLIAQDLVGVDPEEGKEVIFVRNLDGKPVLVPVVGAKNSLNREPLAVNITDLFIWIEETHEIGLYWSR